MVDTSGNTSSVSISSEKILNAPKALYNAFVGWDPSKNQKLDGRLSVQQLNSMRTAFRDQALQAGPSTYLSNFYLKMERCAGRYAALLENTTNDRVALISKSYYPEMQMRHSLVNAGGTLIESLVWMEKGELQDLNDGYAHIGGHPRLPSNEDIDNMASDEKSNIKLGAGAFGVVRIGRLFGDVDSEGNVTNNDQYVAIKKAHPELLKAAPEPSKIVQGLNDRDDNSQTRIFKTWEASSSKTGFSIGGVTPVSQYAAMELGTVDLETIVDVSNYLRFMLEATKSDDDQIRRYGRKLMKECKSSYDEKFPDRIQRLGMFDADNVVKLLNTLAFKMLLAVNEVHQGGYVHRDIKPDNFVLTKVDGEGFKIKLIDYDFLKDEATATGFPADVYCRVYSSREVSKVAPNNLAFQNDSYSLGVSFKRILGHSSIELIEDYNANRAQQKNVVDRLSVDAVLLSKPDIFELSGLSNLMRHDHPGKRISVSESLEMPTFTPERMLDEDELETFLSELVRYYQCFDRKEIQEFNPAIPSEAIILSSEISDDRKIELLEKRELSMFRHGLVTKGYYDYLGEKIDVDDMKDIAATHKKEQRKAFRRRFVRNSNPLHHLKSSEQKQADYRISEAKRRARNFSGH